MGKVTVCRVVILNDDKAQRLLEKVGVVKLSSISVKTRVSTLVP